MRSAGQAGCGCAWRSRRTAMRGAVALTAPGARWRPARGGHGAATGSGRRRRRPAALTGAAAEGRRGRPGSGSPPRSPRPARRSTASTSRSPSSARRFGAPPPSAPGSCGYLRRAGATGVRIDATGLFADATMRVAPAQRAVRHRAGRVPHGRAGAASSRPTDAGADPGGAARRGDRRRRPRHPAAVRRADADAASAAMARPRRRRAARRRRGDHELRLRAAHRHAGRLPGGAGQRLHAQPVPDRLRLHAAAQPPA